MTDPIIDIPIDELHDSPFQPRASLPRLQSMADTLQADGRINSPLLVRPRAAGGYEIVFGHRRRGGAELLQWATVPCMVRAMSDAEVRAAQMSENIAREGMQALEEAAGLKRQIDEDGISASELARRIGKSASWVCGRIKLLGLHPTVRAALSGGEIDAESALLVARVGPPALQEKALAAINSSHLFQDLKDGGRRSYRNVRNLLVEKFTLDLKKAMFDPEDATLAAPAGPCSACPKRSGNAPEWHDVANASTARDQHGMHVDHLPKKGADVCTDPDCFDAKKKDHLQRESAKLAQAGHTVVDGAKARQAISATGEIKGDYVPIKDATALLKTVKGAKVDAVTILDPRTGKTHKAVKKEALAAAGVKVSDKPATGRNGRAESRDREAERREREARGKALTEQRMALLRRVHAAAAGRPRTLDDLRLLVAYLLDETMYGDNSLATLAQVWGYPTEQAFTEATKTMGADDLALVMLGCAYTHQFEAGGYDKEPEPAYLITAARQYGIDPDAPEADPPPTPATAAQAKKVARPTVGKAAAGSVKYRCAATGATWSGRGLQPAWIKAALASGTTLNDLLVEPVAKAPGKGPAGLKVKDNAGCAGDTGRDPNTGDLFEGARA